MREIAPAELAAALAGATAPAPLLVDCREPVEWAVGRIAGARHIPLAQLAAEIGTVAPDPSVPLVVYCEHGVRSFLGARLLEAAGYRTVASLVGGLDGWATEGFPVETAPAPGAPAASAGRQLTAEERTRYSRHLLMPEIGPEGQARLLDARVLVVGAGGLGSPALLYLAAAGVGRIEVVDFDRVELSNLQRQVIHATDRLGEPKAVSARRAIEALNPGVAVVAHEAAFDAGNATRLLDGVDVVIDGTDSFETRYLLNDAAVAARVPVVHASVYRFEGQLTVFAPGGPCYRCLYPTPPPPELAPACSVAGVLGVVPGVVGLLQATEALKLLLGIGEPLVGRLLLYDALDATTSEVRLARDPACPACG